MGLAVLLGCDYLPQGVPQVGKVKGMELIQNIKPDNLIQRYYLHSVKCINVTKTIMISHVQLVFHLLTLSMSTRTTIWTNFERTVRLPSRPTSMSLSPVLSHGSGLLYMYRCETWRTKAPDTFIIDILRCILRLIFLELYIGEQFYIQFLLACIYILFIFYFLFKNALSFICFL